MKSKFDSANKILKACEQLNSWLGGYASIVKRMTPSNFNWFLHTMFFLHTKRVLQKAENRGTDNDEYADMDEEEEEEDQ